MLRHENQRLEHAVRSMARRIDVLEGAARESGGSSAARINDILNKYAPAEDIDMMEESALAARESTNSHINHHTALEDGTSKKRRVAEAYSDRADMHLGPTHMSPPFAIAASPDFQQAASSWDGQHIGRSDNTDAAEGPRAWQAQGPSTQAFETLMQLSRLRNVQPPTNAAESRPLSAATAMSSAATFPNFEQQPASLESTGMQPASSSMQEFLPESFWELIDWDESLQNWW